ncbi:MAG TPA: M55 family metallopeptidase [Clostridia bacterium]|nr:M55 family metallopeptidase [Clostridia bacterium]
MKSNTEKALIVVDLEGIIGLELYTSQEHARELMRDELLCAIDCIIRWDDRYRITVCNIHCDGQLLCEADLLPCGETLLKGITALAACSWDFDFAIMLGFHGKANSGGMFDHTFRPDFRRIRRAQSEIEMGEVAAFMTWIESKRIPVILVSGEGNFEGEISNPLCVVHKIDRYLSKANQLCSLNASLEACLLEEHIVSDVEDVAKIYVQVDNSDKLPIIESEGFTIDDGLVVFHDLDYFFRNLYRFAGALCVAYRQVVEKNREFAKAVKALGIEKEEFPELSEIFARPLDLINEDDRRVVRQRLGL